MARRTFGQRAEAAAVGQARYRLEARPVQVGRSGDTGTADQHLPTGFLFPGEFRLDDMQQGNLALVDRHSLPCPFQQGFHSGAVRRVQLAVRPLAHRLAQPTIQQRDSFAFLLCGPLKRPTAQGENGMNTGGRNLHPTPSGFGQSRGYLIFKCLSRCAPCG